ncbi:MAG TPA: PQQ-binding-like beta-propeller repeat protein [bacterium]|nr:PQQ-binding-like beta-propeller repeat protein [bacterium]
MHRGLIVNGVLVCALLAGGAVPPASPAPQALPWGARRANPVLPDDVLIADASNNRILLVTPDKHIVWQMPQPGRASPLRDDDDVFFGPHFDEIITNEEDHHMISIIDFRTRRIVWSYGHPGVPGRAPGYLNTPDDAFLYARGGGLITAADIKNQRIVFIDRRTKRIIKQYGHTGVMRIDPPRYFSAPNGDFPAPDQGMLVTQINGNDAILLDREGRVVWTLRFPSAFYYPSDANFTPDGNVICVFYTNPGAIVIMSPKGKVLWQYQVLSGPGRLNHPSLAVQLPNRMVLLNDDFNHRVIVIDPATKRIVWQYGHTGVPGTAPGYLNVPDGVDVLPAGVTPGASNPIGRHLWSYPGNGY